MQVMIKQMNENIVQGIDLNAPSAEPCYRTLAELVGDKRYYHRAERERHYIISCAEKESVAAELVESGERISSAEKRLQKFDIIKLQTQKDYVADNACGRNNSDRLFVELLSDGVCIKRIARIEERIKHNNPRRNQKIVQILVVSRKARKYDRKSEHIFRVDILEKHRYHTECKNRECIPGYAALRKNAEADFIGEDKLTDAKNNLYKNVQHEIGEYLVKPFFAYCPLAEKSRNKNKQRHVE